MFFRKQLMNPNWLHLSVHSIFSIEGRAVHMLITSENTPWGSHFWAQSILTTFLNLFSKPCKDSMLYKGSLPKSHHLGLSCPPRVKLITTNHKYTLWHTFPLYRLVKQHLHWSNSSQIVWNSTEPYFLTTDWVKAIIIMIIIIIITTTTTFFRYYPTMQPRLSLNF